MGAAVGVGVGAAAEAGVKEGTERKKGSNVSYSYSGKKEGCKPGPE